MIVTTVDSGLESLVRAELPLPPEVGDVSLDPPSGTWSAQLNRITVNLFLFGVGRSAQQPRPPVDREVNGRRQRRPMLPMMELHYLVTAWAGSVRDEHQLIGDLLGCFLSHQALPGEYLEQQPDAMVQLSIAPHDNGRAKDVWSTVGGTIRPSFELVATTQVDGIGYRDLAPAAERIDAMVSRLPQNRG